MRLDLVARLGSQFAQESVQQAQQADGAGGMTQTVGSMSQTLKPFGEA